MEKPRTALVLEEESAQAAGNNRSCCWRFRMSTRTVLVMVCCSLFNDSLLLTLVDPILPKMLYSLEHKQQENGTVELILIDIHTKRKDAEKNYMQDKINNRGRYGYLIASKGAAQFVCNPLIGLLVTRVGYRVPMIVGNILLIGSTLAFALSINYWMLLATRIFQGIASSLTAVTGLGLIAATFKDDFKRGKMIGYVFTGLSLGISAGPVYGSVLYEFVGPYFPFVLLSGIMALNLVIQILALQKEEMPKRQKTSIFKLLRDPYILIVAMNIFLLNLSVSIILAFLPIRLVNLVDPPVWQLGIVVLPSSIGYLLAGIIFPRLVRFFPRWLQAIIGLFVSSGTLLALAYTVTFVQMLVVTLFLGLAVGLISSSMQPIFAKVVDIRHSKVYGNVYAISDMAVCLSMTIGPLIGGPVVYAFGFERMLYGVAVIDIVASPFTLFLKNPLAIKKVFDEKTSLLQNKRGTA